MATAQNAVQVPGLQDLRRDFRAIGKAQAKEGQKVLKDAAVLVAAEAGRNAPHGTRPLGNRRPQKRLAEAYVGTTSGAKGVVVNPLVHASIYEFRKSGTAAQLRGARPVDRAIEKRGDEVVEMVANGFDRVARRNGFR